MRRTQSISHLVTAITAILVVALVTVFAWQAVNALNAQREAVHIKTQSAIARDIVSEGEFRSGPQLFQPVDLGEGVGVEPGLLYPDGPRQ